jgi:hypothetical protein
MRYAEKGNIKYYHLEDYLDEIQKTYTEKYKDNDKILIIPTRRQIKDIFMNQILKKGAKIEVDDETGEEYFKASDVIGGGRFLKK